MKKYKGIVFFDVDGTLIDYFAGILEPTEKTKDSLRKLKEAGYLTILATGRPMSFINEDLLNLGLSGYIASNGSYAELEGEIIFDYPIETSHLEEFIKIFDEYKMEYILEGQEISYVGDKNGQALLDLISITALENENFTDDWDIKTIKVNKIVVLSGNEAGYKILEEKYKDRYAFMRYPSGESFEIYVSKYTKGYGIEQLIEKLGINQEDTYAFGDGENDIEMFQAVKHGIAMGGHHEGLKEHAYDFTETVKNEGIYHGLKKLCLI